MKKLSIITVSYNAENNIAKTIESVLCQSFEDYEYIVIDGNSRDATLNVIKKYEPRFNGNMKWVSEPDLGIYDAMNKGIQKASGEYLMFLNSGDFLIHNDVLKIAIKSTENKKADIYYGNIQLFNEDGTICSQKFPKILTLDFFKHNTINHQSSLIKAALFKELGFYDTSYSLAADYAFYLKSYFLGRQFEYINEDWVHYSLGGISDLNKDQNRLQMKTAWERTIPIYLDNLYYEHKEYSLLMKYRIMLFAKKLNTMYITFKNLLKK